jgi:hypothetical protein
MRPGFLLLRVNVLIKYSVHLTNQLLMNVTKEVFES